MLLYRIQFVNKSSNYVLVSSFVFFHVAFKVKVSIHFEGFFFFSELAFLEMAFNLGSRSQWSQLCCFRTCWKSISTLLISTLPCHKSNCPLRPQYLEYAKLAQFFNALSQFLAPHPKKANWWEAIFIAIFYQIKINNLSRLI